MFVFSEKSKCKKALESKLVNRTFTGEEYRMFIYDSIGNDDMYGVEVFNIFGEKKQLYSSGKLSAIKIVEVAKRFNIKLQ